MLNTLIESRAHTKRNASGTLTAVAAHALIIGLAAYASATASPSPVEAAPVIGIHYAAPQAAAVKSHTASSTTHRASSSSSVARVPSISLNVSPDLPAVDVPLASPGTVRSEDFGSPSTTLGTADTGPSTEPAAYTDIEVESQVAVISGLRPEYPAALRASGVEGRVVAQFIVDASGKTDPQSIKILSSTSELFSESVRRALLRSRFRPASIRSKNVPQLVQQLFVFRLDR